MITRQDHNNAFAPEGCGLVGGPPATAERVLRMMETSAEQHFGPLSSLLFADVGEGMPRAPGVKPSV